MKSINEILSEKVKEYFQKAISDTDIDLSGITAVPTENPQFGDYQCNASMMLGKKLKKAPREIAESVVNAISADQSEMLEKVEIAGPGFINMYLKDEWLVARLEEMTKGVNIRVAEVGEGKTVVIDYSSPNIAKPMHIAHIRSTIIGNSIDRLHRLLGYKVVADNHVGDWGTQFGILIMGYRNFLDKEAFQKAPIEELERIYIKSNEKKKEDEEWLTQCRQELVKLQAGDEENKKLWDEFVALSLKEFDRIYKRLNVEFDLVRGESFYNNDLPGVVQELEEKGIAEQSEGATVVFVEGDEVPLIVRKQDGGFNYATTDLATVASRVDEFNPDKIIYVTDDRQQAHFKKFFVISKKLGYEVDLVHVKFGLLRFPEGMIMATREGNVIKLEHLLDEAESRALDIVKKSSPEMDETQQKEVARSVGIGAVKYADLSQSPQTTVTFTWEKALALDGNSGPYLQYAYARIASVLDKYKERFPDIDSESYPLNFSEPIERTLAIKVLRFSEVVIRAAHSYKPSVLADYLYDLAQTYSSFYQNVPFLKADEGVRESRMRLSRMVAAVLSKGLDLLGIETPERI